MTRSLFTTFYTSSFWVLILCLTGLILIPPGDMIRQVLHNNNVRIRTAYFIVIGGSYGATAFVAGFLYTLRLWTNRRVLAEIPKTWIPIEKGDVPERVRKMIVFSLNRSAAIAWDARPQIPIESPAAVSEPENPDHIVKPVESESHENVGPREARAHDELEEHMVAIPPDRPVWGEIAHNGWSSPTSPDLPNLQYVTVILELPHLVEAKAVSLAPTDSPPGLELPLPDIRAVDILQRPAAMGLRDYIGHLTGVGVIASPTTATQFLASYESARFSARPVSESQFRNLMKQFAELLRSMTPLAPDMLAGLDIDPPESDTDDVSTTSTPTTNRSRSLTSSKPVPSRDSSEGTIRTIPSRSQGPNGSPRKTREKFSTAPATPKSKRRAVSRTSSMNSFAQSRRPYDGSSADSSESLRSTSQGSVIRLSQTKQGDALPYVLKIPTTR